MSFNQASNRQPGDAGGQQESNRHRSAAKQALESGVQASMEKPVFVGVHYQIREESVSTLALG